MPVQDLAERAGAALSHWLTGEHQGRAELAALVGWVLALLTTAWFVLVEPGGSYTAIWPNDVMGLIAAAYRTHLGQVPSIDFQSIYGVAVYHPAALGFLLGFHPSAVLAFGHFVVAAALLPLAAITAHRRLSILPSMVLLLFLCLLIVTPVQMGGPTIHVSFGVFYNRHAYAALAIVLLFYLEPRRVRPSITWTDSVVLSLLLLFLIYSKATFAAVALGFVVANAITSRWKLRSAMVSLGITFCVVGGVGILTSYNTAYLADVMDTAQRSGARLVGGRRWLGTLHLHAWSVTAALLALPAARLAGRRSPFDVAFVAGAIGACFVLRDFSGGGTKGFPLLISVFLVFAELARRMQVPASDAAPHAWSPRAASLSILALLIVFVSQPVLGNLIALRHHHRETSSPRLAVPIAGLAGFAYPDGSRFDDGHLHEKLGHDEAAHLRLAGLRRRTLNAGDYFPLIIEGSRLLLRATTPADAVVVFEKADPFSAVLGLRPTRYGFPLFFEGGPFSAESHPDPTRFFSDADHVMVPVVPHDQRHLELLQELYGPHLETHFEPTARSLHWRLWSRKRDGAPGS